MAQNGIPFIEPLNEIDEQFHDEVRQRFQNFLGPAFSHFINQQVDQHNIVQVHHIPDPETRSDAVVYEIMHAVIQTNIAFHGNPVEIHETIWDIMYDYVLMEIPGAQPNQYQIPADVIAGNVGVDQAGLKQRYPDFCAEAERVLKRCCPVTGVTPLQVAVWYDNITAARLMCNFVNCFQDNSRHIPRIPPLPQIPGQMESLIHLGEHFITPFWLAAMLENIDICEYFLQECPLSTQDKERPTAIRLSNHRLVNYNIYTVMRKSNHDILRFYFHARHVVPFTEALLMLKEPLLHGFHGLRHVFFNVGLMYWAPVRITMKHIETLFTLYFQEGVLDTNDIRDYLACPANSLRHVAVKALFLNSCLLYLASNMHGLDTSDARIRMKLVAFLDALGNQQVVRMYGMTRPETDDFERMIEDYFRMFEGQIYRFRFSRWHIDPLKELHSSVRCDNHACQEACSPDRNIIPACLRHAVTAGDGRDFITLELARRSGISWLSSDEGISRIPVDTCPGAGTRRLHDGPSSCIELTPSQGSTSMEEMTSMWAAESIACANNADAAIARNGAIDGMQTPPP